MSGRQLSAGWERQQKEPLVGCGLRGRRIAGGQELMGSDLATTANWRMLQRMLLKVETPSEGWTPSDDISSRSPGHGLSKERLHVWDLNLNIKLENHLNVN